MCLAVSPGLSSIGPPWECRRQPREKPAHSRRVRSVSLSYLCDKAERQAQGRLTRPRRPNTIPEFTPTTAQCQAKYQIWAEALADPGTPLPLGQTQAV